VNRTVHNTMWEQLEDFKMQFPQVELTDELFIDEGRNAVNAFVGRHYGRRTKRGAAPATISIK
jgi:transcriptional regulator GlxA family with amidase domain